MEKQLHSREVSAPSDNSAAASAAMGSRTMAPRNLRAPAANRKAVTTTTEIPLAAACRSEGSKSSCKATVAATPQIMAIIAASEIACIGTIRPGIFRNAPNESARNTVKGSKPRMRQGTKSRVPTMKTSCSQKRAMATMPMPAMIRPDARVLFRDSTLKAASTSEGMEGSMRFAMGLGTPVSPV
ncbi:MAG: hypothetical protein A2Y36_01105 [Treponema sp. GWA1_62_8]|nr:MAG: hypothetical protein A2Y36_01105 [Treponema sp. GWA1_62_8]